MPPRKNVANNFGVFYRPMHFISKSGNIIHYRNDEQKRKLRWTNGLINSFRIFHYQILHEKNEVSKENNSLLNADNLKINYTEKKKNFHCGLSKYIQ